MQCTFIITRLMLSQSVVVKKISCIPHCFRIIDSWLVLRKKIKYLIPSLRSNVLQAIMKVHYDLFHLSQLENLHPIVMFQTKLITIILITVKHMMTTCISVIKIGNESVCKSQKIISKSLLVYP